VATDTVTVKFKVLEDGSLQAVGKHAEKAAAGLNKAGSSADRYNKKAKGVGQANLSAGKSMSKMAQGSNGLVAAYATLAANIFALTALFGALKRAAQFEILQEGFERLGNTAGRTSTVIAGQLRSITNDAISMEQALRTSANAFSAGFSDAELVGLTKVAKGASAALGRDLPDALDRLVRGTAKLEPEILDELGIFVKIDDAVKNYASTLGKSVSEITAAERRQAFLNETLTQGALKFGDVADNIDTNPYDKLGASFKDLTTSFLNILSFVTPLVELVAKSTLVLIGTLVLFGTSVAKFMFPALQQLGEKYTTLSKQALKSAEVQVEAQKKVVESAKQAILKKTGIGENTKFAKLQKKLANGEVLSLKELEVMNTSLLDSIKKRKQFSDKSSKKEVKNHRDATAEILRQKRAVDALKRSEEGLGKKEEAISNINRAADTQGGVGNSINKIQQGGAFKGFKTASKSLKEFSAEAANTAKVQGTMSTGIAFLDKKLLKFAPTLVKGSAAVRLFGAAFINAIPFIGQIVFVVGLLIAGATKLYNVLNPTTEAAKRLEEQSEALKGKLEQLNKTNEGLLSGYQEVLIQEEIRKNSIGGITEATLQQINAQARQLASTKAHANNLKVLSGVLSEYSSGIEALRQEQQKQAKEGPGFFARLVAVAYPMRIMRGIIRWLSAGFADLANKIKNISAVLSDLKDTIIEALPFLSQLSIWFSEFGKDEAIRTRQTNDKDNFVSAILDQYTDMVDSLEGQPALQDLLLKTLSEKELKDSIKTAFEGFDDASKTTEQRAEQLKKAMISLTSKISAATYEVTKASHVYEHFGGNIKEAQANLVKFFSTVSKKNPYRSLSNDVSTVRAEIQKLEDATGGAGTESFEAALFLQIKTAGLDLTTYGLTQEEVANRGAEAFDFLKDSIDRTADSFDNNKTKIEATKKAIENLNAVFADNAATDKFKASIENLEKSGKFAVSIADKFRLNREKRSDMLRTTQSKTSAGFLNDKEVVNVEPLGVIEQRLTLKNKLARLETTLKIQKIELLKINAKGDEETLRNLQKQIVSLEGLRDARLEANKADRDRERIAAENEYQVTNQTTRAELQASLKKGNTVDRVRALGDGGGLENLEFENKDGTTNKAYGAKLEALKSVTSPMMESLAALGPDGEFMSSIAQGAFTISEAFTSAFEDIDMSAGLTAANMSEGLGAAAEVMGAVGSILSAQSDARVASIDQEIAAEKKRDGKSAGSLAKINALEQKKEKTKKKSFETQKKLNMASIIMSTASAAMAAYTPAEGGNPATGTALAAMIVALGAAQLAVVAGTSYQGGGSAVAAAASPSAVEVGSRSNTVDLAKGNNAGGELAYARGASGIGTGMDNFKPTSAFAGYKGRAAGGYLVGEQGPEVFMPETAGNIIPAGKETGGMTNVNFSISAVDASGVEDLLMNQRGNIIAMLREAANEHGELFLEGVQDKSY